MGEKGEKTIGSERPKRRRLIITEVSRHDDLRAELVRRGNLHGVFQIRKTKRQRFQHLGAANPLQFQEFEECPDVLGSFFPLDLATARARCETAGSMVRVIRLFISA